MFEIYCKIKSTTWLTYEHHVSLHAYFIDIETDFYWNIIWKGCSYVHFKLVLQTYNVL